MHGIVLTQTDDLTAFLSSLRAAHVPLLKVVTQWGYSWTPTAIQMVTSTMPSLIVRTVNGDGCRPPPPGQSVIFLEPSSVLAELDPWLSVRPDLLVELGNEPNQYDAGDDAAWVFRYWFIETVSAIRDRWPAARIVSPGLVANRQADWWAICQDAFAMADMIGFHAYAWNQFVASDNGGQLQAAMKQLAATFPAQPWIGTELGINDPPTSDATKCDRYYSTRLKLPSQVAGVCWYHACTRPGDPDASAYALDPSSWSHLKAGGTL